MEAVELLRKAANPVRIILFGSYARGDMKTTSDLDFLIVEKDIKACRMETVRLQDVVKSSSNTCRIDLTKVECGKW